MPPRPSSTLPSADFTGLLLGNAIAISMDGRGAWRDNVFVERLWRSVKYEEVYLRAYDSVSEARSPQQVQRPLNSRTRVTSGRTGGSLMRS